ncbi:hypothetical protein CEXT_160181 [Caerostris extrusa]|uniref:Uncharacterized protein n=1 Tax=Caerostris extrusa TaxID=172846 RepID=A0AAV4NE25_CAEEX|nr:hypothetical protein CEXT_160181 [Caerostris extrusa]
MPSSANGKLLDYAGYLVYVPLSSKDSVDDRLYSPPKYVQQFYINGHLGVPLIHHNITLTCSTLVTQQICYFADYGRE